tara:strand:- start:20 stop:469 length:450 start_codon:yes stop_codon:yes gene_type:complete
VSRDEFLEEVIDINPLNIDEHFRKVPAELAYYNQQYADSFDKYLRAKMLCERAHAEAYKRISQDAESEGRRVTVSALEAAVLMDMSFQMAKEDLVEAESEKQRLRGKVEVVSAKKEMLISLGAHIRVEMNDPMIRAQSKNNKEAMDPEY